jgi:DNA-binding XRE family transcriptional regulator
VATLAAAASRHRYFHDLSHGTALLCPCELPSYNFGVTDSDNLDALFKAVGARIRDLRNQAGLNQPEFAKAAGVSAQYAWRIEDGRQNLSLRTMSRIAIALGVPMSALLEGIEADPGSLQNRAYRRSKEDDQVD